VSKQQPRRKRCESQLFDEQPNEAWDIERLGAFARARHQEIDADEQSLARAYWRLGMALNLARSQFSHGQWAKFLEELGIGKTRASKDRAIRRSFDNEDAVEGLLVQEAYRQRKRKSRKSGPNKKRRKSANTHERVGIVDWLRDVCQQADFFFDEVASANTEDAANVHPVIDAAVEELSRLRNQLQQRVGTRP